MTESSSSSARTVRFKSVGGLKSYWFIVTLVCFLCSNKVRAVNGIKPTGYVMHQQFNIQQLYVLPTLYLCVLYLSENKQRLVPLTAKTDWFL